MRSRADLLLYKRHSASCRVHQAPMLPEIKRFYFACDCPIWITGHTPQGAEVPRQSTGLSNLQEAIAWKKALIAQGNATATPNAIHGPTIGESVEKYLASHGQAVGTKTLGQHRLLLARLDAHCTKHGVRYTSGLTVDLLETFLVEGFPGLKDTSKASGIAKLRCFLRTAYRRGWIPEHLVDRLTTFRGAGHEQKEPFSEEEVTLILAEASKLKGGTHGYAKQPHTLQLLLRLMLETGLRIGDAVRYDPEVCERSEHLWVHTFVPQKSRRPVPIEAYLQEPLKLAIDKCTWLSADLPFSWGMFANESYLANEVYYRMRTIGERCGVPDCRPHRLRDTFAVRALLRGIPLEDLSRLLGHSSVKVTEMHYAKWTRARKARLERLMHESLTDS